MSKHDPRQELNLIIASFGSGRVNKNALGFAKGALPVAEKILETMASMEQNGYIVPTEGQAKALKNIYLAACKWLGRMPNLE